MELAKDIRNISVVENLPCFTGQIISNYIQYTEIYNGWL